MYILIINNFREDEKIFLSIEEREGLCYNTKRVVKRMDKMSRIQKYKDLREQINDEVAIDRSKETQVVEEVEDDEFLKEIQPKGHSDIVVDALSDDTLEGVTFDHLLGEEEEQAVDQALSRAKAYGGREFDTRMDIYNRIRKGAKAQPKVESKDPVEEPQPEKREEPEKKMTLLEKLAVLSPEVDVEEEVKEILEHPEVSPTPVKDVDITEETDIISLDELQKAQQVIQEEEVEENIEEEIDEEDDEEPSKWTKVLNGIIIVLVIMIVCLFGYLVKMMLF